MHGMEAAKHISKNAHCKGRSNRRGLQWPSIRNVRNVKHSMILVIQSKVDTEWTDTDLP